MYTAFPYFLIQRNSLCSSNASLRTPSDGDLTNNPIRNREIPDQPMSLPFNGPPTTTSIWSDPNPIGSNKCIFPYCLPSHNQPSADLTSKTFPTSSTTDAHPTYLSIQTTMTPPKHGTNLTSSTTSPRYLHNTTNNIDQPQPIEPQILSSVIYTVMIRRSQHMIVNFMLGSPTLNDSSVP